MLERCVNAAAAWLLAVMLSGGSTAAIGADGNIRGVVTGGDGAPEAGVWVIAETADLGTPMRKIVVTDGNGNFLIPQLPAADYQVWVRGYGLRDSARTGGQPGTTLTLKVDKASNAQEAAAIYPASYWLSLANPPEGDPGWTSYFKLGCQLCHQIGSPITRGFSAEQFDHGFRKATYMDVTADGLGRTRLLAMLDDWTARIRAGETPPAPPRPSGIERNLVITQWAWGDAFTYAHDEIATDKRNAARYPHGRIYGVDLANDRLLWVDPVRHAAGSVDVPTRDGFATPWCNQTYQPLPAGDGKGDSGVIPMGFGSLGCATGPGISAFEGKYDNPANPHNPMFDDQGRVWMTTQIRREWGEDLPAFCRRDPVIANNYHHRQLGFYDTRTGRTELVDTCYGTHHLQFDDKGVLWVSGDSFVVGWFDPAKYDPAKPATLETAQGWSELRADGDGDGKEETPLVGFNYGIIPNPVDGSVWVAQPGGNPGGDTTDRGRLVRFDPATGKHETYMAPTPAAGPRGVDVDTNGIIWVAFGGSGHLGRFDRSKCSQHWGLGDQCPEGWSLYRSPGPLMRVTGEGDKAMGADFHYYLFVDQFDTLGLGKDTVVLNGTGSDSLLAFSQATSTFTVIRIPYPLNTYTRGLDGRIDDAGAGWRGRGLWFTNGTDPLHHSENPTSFVGHVQVRPNPLAE
ncbi:MAG: carboxypeptidase regulatory-like domain-containing protein [Pseudomonadales bacterium]|nr:carboxypeptidase regulatory-like domain-containing protein [Pseudomonadales bacterium]